MAELLLELFSEEIPARMQAGAAEQLKKRFTDVLVDAGLTTGAIYTYVTPRRLTLMAEGLPASQEDKEIERKGPRVDAAEGAIEGFAKSAGVARDALIREKTDKGEFYFARFTQKGQSVAEALKPLLETILSSFTWPKSMRWGDQEIYWVRPLRSILCIFDGKVIPVSFGALTASNVTYGHRFLAPGALTISNAADYRTKLEKAFIMLDPEVRKKKILEQAGQLTKEKYLTLREDAGLLDEVAGLVEWPMVRMGSIDALFMHLPAEVLVTSIRTHQKYFCTLHEDGRLASHFLVVTNTPGKEEGAAIVKGNERVLRARLSDAGFFWEQDRKTTLEERIEALKSIIFHAELGTVLEKTERVGALAQFLAVWVPHANLTLIGKAARLCKADLTTSIVGEFPELQGIMGYYYATAEQIEPEVATALKEHYMPVGANDAIPTNPVSVAVALADKFDTLCGLFAAGEKPTGSKDPFALRRAALGIIRIILENRLSIPLKLAIGNALSRLPVKAKQEALTAELLSFFAERLKSLLKAEGIRHDLIQVVFGDGTEDDLLRLTVRAAALQRFLSTEDGQNLLAAYRRAANIVEIEEKKDKTHFRSEVKKSLLEQAEEQALYEALEDLRPELKKALKEEQFEAAMGLLSRLRAPIDAFLNQVVVNADQQDIRKNRLHLLSQMREWVNEIADFSKIEVER